MDALTAPSKALSRAIVKWTVDVVLPRPRGEADDGFFLFFPLLPFPFSLFRFPFFFVFFRFFPFLSMFYFTVRCYCYSSCGGGAVLWVCFSSNPTIEPALSARFNWDPPHGGDIRLRARGAGVRRGGASHRHQEPN